LPLNTSLSLMFISLYLLCRLLLYLLRLFKSP
jgi:hypothetical protein